MYRDKALSVVVRAPTRGLVTRLPGESADYLPQQGAALLPGTIKRAASAASNVRYEEGVVCNAPGYEKIIPTSPLLTGLVAQWSLDEISGTRQDSSFNNHDLAEITGRDLLSGKPVTNVGFEAGRFNNAALFPALRALPDFIALSQDSLTGFLGSNLTNAITSSGIAYIMDKTTGNFYSSVDGLNWSLLGSSQSSGLASPLVIAFGASKFVGAGLVGQIASSTDGINWTFRVSGLNGLPGTQGFITTLIWDGSQFVAGALGGGVITSPDGITWSNNGHSPGFQINGLAKGAGLYIAVGPGGVISSSPDLITWTSRSSGVASDLHAVVFGGTHFVALADGDMAVSSTAGTTWSVNGIPISPFNILTSVAFGNSKFVAVNNGGAVCSSPDGATWTLVASYGFALNTVSYFTGNTFIVGT